VDIKSKKNLVILLLIIWSAVVFPVKFALISDPHIELGNKLIQDTERRFSLSTTLLSNAVNQINSDPSLDFVVLTGDIINNGRSWNLDSAQYILENLNIPYYVVMGNNDFATPDQGSGISKFTFQYAFEDNMPNLKNGVWYHKVKDTIIVGIDNINPVTGSENWSDRILSQLEAVFLNYPTASKIIFTHYPIIDYTFSATSKRLTSTDDFIELAKQYNVKLICSGHYHYKEFSNLDGIISFVSPALVEYPHEYLTIKLSNTTLAIAGSAVTDGFVLQESETLSQKRIKRLKYIYPDLSESVLKAKIKGENYYYYEWQN